MGPTICQDKKQLRVSSLKDTRRRPATSAAATSNAATQSSVVLSYVAKGSVNSGTRLQRNNRRAARLLRSNRLPQISHNTVSSSTPGETEEQQQQSQNKEASAGEAYQYLPAQRMEIDANASDDAVSSFGMAMQPRLQHSNPRLPAKTVLQPTTANNMPTAKHCDPHNNDHGDRRDGDGVDSDFDNQTVKCAGHQHQLLPNTDGLLSIAIKTIKLVQRNKLLQKRLSQLQLETSEFIASVLANPENRHLKINAKADGKVYNMLLRH